ncbi:MAG: prepilin-type N-terminal cleavage/methylation domain-containing protein [Lachnospiraceae bacterium]|nr:prepilin-type N-terminal cleavage/methylation domain-containing protein [Lachnospiraceae bacterium]MBQ6259446.1 prepilin-type N-terminal cleavage/methylation domain-containing protein [Lachnospiraceae bacterium]
MKKRALKKLFSRRKRVQASRDNRGFTLLELIIAMAIFAVITIPIMNMFSKSAELNGKARKVQNTNDAASSIAETIKAADLFDAFNLKGEKDSVAPESTKLIALFGADGVIGSPTMESGKLSFQLSGVPSGGRKYDAAITLDPAASPYFEARNKESVTTGQNVTQYYPESKNAGSTPYDIAISKLLKDVNDTVNSHSRKIDIAFNLKTEGGKQVVTATVTYTYTINYNEYWYNNETGIETWTPKVGTQPVEVYSANILNFDNSGNKEDHPISFFLFYNPDYTGTGYPKDQITISNPNKLTGGVYIIKQKEEGLTHSRENSYSAWIDLSEPHSTSEKMNLTVGTNINISHVDDTYGKKLTGNYLVRNKVSNTVVRTMEPEGDYISSSDYDRVYAYTVKVYEPTGVAHDDSETPVYELSGVRLR